MATTAHPDDRFFCFLIRFVRISANVPDPQLELQRLAKRSNQRACPLVSIPTRHYVLSSVGDGLAGFAENKPVKCSLPGATHPVGIRPIRYVGPHPKARGITRRKPTSADMWGGSALIRSWTLNPCIRSSSSCQLVLNRVSNNVGPCQALFERTTACTQRRAPFRSHRWCCLSQPSARS
jgi:hypothetical protein